MSKITVEIEDTLQDCVDSAIEQVKEQLENYLQENPDTEKTPCLNNDLDYSGAIHEIIDGCVPIHNSEIKNIMFLHGDEVEQAFDDAGIGSKDDKGWPMGWKPAAVYCYIQEKVNEWYYNEADELFDEWVASTKENEGDVSENKD